MFSDKILISFCTEQNRQIEAVLQEMKKQLTQVQGDINILKASKTRMKSKNTSMSHE